MLSKLAAYISAPDEEAVNAEAEVDFPCGPTTVFVPDLLNTRIDAISKYAVA